MKKIAIGLLALLLTALPVAAAHPALAAAGAAAAQGETWSQPEGFRFTVPIGWQVDRSLGPVVTRLTGPEAEIEVYQFPLSTDSSLDGFWSYANRSLREGWARTKVDQQWESKVGGLRARWVRWHRPTLATVPNDQSYYAEFALERPGQQLFHVFLRATPAGYARAYADLQKLAGSLVFTTPTGKSAWTKAEQPPTRDPFLQKRVSAPSPLPGKLEWNLPKDRPVWGIWDPPVVKNQGPAEQLEQELGGHFGVYMFYWVLGWDFPTQQMDRMVASGRMPMLTLQSWVPEDPLAVYEHESTLTMAILDGKYDDYFRRFAREAARFGHPIFMRYDNEMNGDWDPWCAWHYGKDTKLYRLAWRHVHQLMDQEGATNLLWVWNPNADSYPNYGWNNAALYYPGDDVVDWIGLTGYNTGGDSWRSFRSAYTETYALANHLAPSKPVMITEFASHEEGGDKAAWIRDMWQTLPDFPKIRIAVWWNENNASHSYRIDTSPAAKDAFAAGFPAYAAVPFRFVPESGAPTYLELSHHWGAAAYTAAMQRGLNLADPDGALRPGAYITVSQFDRLLAGGALQEPARDPGSYDLLLSRQALAARVGAAYGWQEPVMGQRYQDHDWIAAANRDAVYALQVHGILLGYDDGTFRPQRFVTRAEAVTVLNRLAALSVRPAVREPVR